MTNEELLEEAKYVLITESVHSYAIKGKVYRVVDDEDEASICIETYDPGACGLGYIHKRYLKYINFTDRQAIDHLKSKGYKILKPTWEEV